MPFLKNLFTIIFTIAVLVFLVWLIVPEIMAAIAAVNIRSEVGIVLQNARKPSHDNECVVGGGGFGGERPLSAYQLRFENDTEYVIEAVCTTFLSKPAIVKTGKIIGMAQKISGYSGVKIPVTQDGLDNWVVVGFLGRNWAVGYKDNKVTMMRVWDTKLIPATDSASNTCSGWGYMCCSETNQQGAGLTPASGVLDCPTNCNSQCLSKPTVAVFNTDPAPEANRVLYLRGGQRKVTFYWKIQDADGQIKRVVIDFGDGNVEEFESDNHGTPHDYVCSSNCRFQASIKAYDNDGLENTDAALASKITVVVE